MIFEHLDLGVTFTCSPCIIDDVRCGLLKHVYLTACAETGGVRPFGASLLMSGFDDNGPQLYQIDPSGSFFAWKASAIGKNMTNAKAFLEKRFSDEVGYAMLYVCVCGLWVVSSDESQHALRFLFVLVV